MNKNKNIYMFIGVGVVVVPLILCGIALFIYNKAHKPEYKLTEYVNLINSKDYEKMYELIDDDIKKKVSKEDFVARNKARVATRNMASSRQKKLDNMDIIELAKEKPKPEFNFKEARTSGKLIFETENLFLLKFFDKIYIIFMIKNLNRIIVFYKYFIKYKLKTQNLLLTYCRL